jgi:hypothetical protein
MHTTTTAAATTINPIKLTEAKNKAKSCLPHADRLGHAEQLCQFFQLKYRPRRLELFSVHDLESVYELSTAIRV